jgi:hypothetical protein
MSDAGKGAIIGTIVTPLVWLIFAFVVLAPRPPYSIVWSGIEPFLFALLFAFFGATIGAVVGGAVDDAKARHPEKRPQQAQNGN